MSCFAAALVLFLCAWLALFSAPTSILWIVAIVVTEWGHWVALAAVFLAVVSFASDRSRLGKITAALALAAAFLCALPSIRALTIARDLPQRCVSAFGTSAREAARAVPFSIVDLFRGIRMDAVDVTEYVYAQEGNKQLTLNLYQAKGTHDRRPVVLMVHGGSWTSGTKDQLPAMNRYLAQEHYAVVSINYRHAPKFHSPAPVEDVFRAISFLKENAERLLLDTERIVLIGRSAGGQIALSAAYAGTEPAIRGVVAFYAPADLVFGYEFPSRRGVLDSKKVLEDYLGGAPNEKPDAYTDASAINFVKASTPPTLLIHGQLDPIIWPKQSERLAARLQTAGVPHLYLALPWATHGCEANLSGPSGQLSLYAVDQFLAAVLQPEQARGLR
ncbi:MAG: alpha/beta hydrolase [Verrucomicrobiota bacterium]|nr:alpha/beta hydrolase [Verrucomicrobiota bacterium]